MKAQYLRVFLVAIITMFVTGCWDRTELNDLALNMGLAMDLGQDGTYEASAQIAVPSQLSGSPAGTGGGGGGREKGYYVVSGKGEDTRDAVREMQMKLSRRIHAGHRRAIFVGESLARKGMGVVVDTNARNPETRLRTDLFVVKGGKARDILNVDYPFERVPTLATVKLHKMIGGTSDTEFRDFLMEEFDDSSDPTLPVIEAYRSNGKRKGFRFGGRAIFRKDMKLIGFINADQATYRGWIVHRLNRQWITMPNPSGPGHIAILLSTLDQRVKPIIQGNDIVIYVTLIGKGDVLGNETNIDLTQEDNVEMLEKAFDRYTATQAHALIRQVQQKYGADIFHFGKTIHTTYPFAWRSIKNEWPREFRNVKVKVSSEITIQRVGLVGSFLESNEVPSNE